MHRLHRLNHHSLLGLEKLLIRLHEELSFLRLCHHLHYHRLHNLRRPVLGNLNLRRLHLEFLRVDGQRQNYCGTLSTTVAATVFRLYLKIVLYTQTLADCRSLKRFVLDYEVFFVVGLFTFFLSLLQFVHVGFSCSVQIQSPMFFFSFLVGFNSWEISCCQSYVVNFQVSAFSCSPKLSSQFESHPFYRYSTLGVVNLNKTLCSFIWCVGIFLEIYCQFRKTLIKTAVSLDLSFILHKLASSHLIRWSSYNKSSLTFNRLEVIV